MNNLRTEKEKEIDQNLLKNFFNLKIEKFIILDY